MQKNTQHSRDRWHRSKKENKVFFPAQTGGSFIPKADRKLRKFFAEIGVPEQKPFVPDAFQLNAIEKIKYMDVMVSAPTGSGKTWIAVQAMKEMLSQGKRSWYSTPLKALSNSKYVEFGEEFGNYNVGILTGDRKENTDAKIIVGTTEILRNHLYDSMHTGEDFPADLVVMDEAHYLGDSDRGVVWEEVMIYLPQRVRLLMLSATIQNDREISQWLTSIRNKPCHVVHDEKRPVPIYPLYLFPNGEIVPLSGFDGVSPQIRDFLTHSRGDRFRRSSYRLPYGKILDAMEEFNLLPSIFFLKSRDDCNKALLSCMHRKLDSSQSRALAERVAELLHEYPFLGHHYQLDWALKYGVGAHHGGQLPHWKIVVEKLMNEGYLDAIFSTSTVAAGVNFPARTVVLVQSDRFNGREFVDLTAMELHQAIGRAGRRGKDKIGFALIVHGPFQNPHLIDALMDSHPEPIKSQIKINFSMALNLLLSHSPEEIRQLLTYSFATYQNIEALESLEEKRDAILQKLAYKMDGCLCEDYEQVVSRIQKRRDSYYQLSRLGKKRKRFAEELFKEKHLYKGKLFTDKKGALYCSLGIYSDHEETACLCLKVQGHIRTRAGKLRPIKLSMSMVKLILDGSVLLPDDMLPEEWSEIRKGIAHNTYEQMSIPHYADSEHEAALHELIKRINTLDEQIKQLPCERCTHFALCHQGKKNHFLKLIEKVKQATDDLDNARNALWKEFTRYLFFLMLNGFADESGKLTGDGLWAAQLRLDQPLMIAELIRREILLSLSPELLCGIIATFVNDKYRDLQINDDTLWDRGSLAAAFSHMRNSLGELIELKRAHGFEVSLMQFWPAVALYAWACGKSWEDVIKLTSVDEGDLAMLIFRTADNLRQIISLEGTHPDLAGKARIAVALILREPVIIPT